MMKKMLGFLLLAFALFYILTQPASAADLMKSAANVVGDLFASLITFMTELFR